MTKRRNLRRRLAHQSSRSLHHETLEKRELLAAEFGPRLISVAANSGQQFNLQANNRLTVSPAELTFRFDGGQQIDPRTLSAIRITGSGGDGTFDDGNDVTIDPGFIGLGESSRIVIARFASDLTDDQYRISISGFDQPNIGLVALRNTDGDLTGPIDGDVFQPLDPANPSAPTQDIFIDVEVGPRVVAVVPQPITGTGASRDHARDQIHVYFNNDPLANPSLAMVETSTPADPNDPSVVRPEFYNLFFTGDTVETGDDGAVHRPTSVRYEPSLNRATLFFDQDIELYSPDNFGTFRLRVGSSQALPATLPPNSADQTSDVGDTFAGAQDLSITFGAAGDSGVTISGEIEATAGNTVQWPGIDAPGVRDSRRDEQVIGRADTTDGVNVFYYNFASLYGTDTSGLNLENAITPAQQQRTREILDLYSEHLGVKFIESEERGLQIVTGVLSSLVETASTGQGLPYLEYRVNDADPTQGVLVLDAGETWFDGYGLSPDTRPSWFVEALRGIGSLLGIGNTFEQVPGVASGSNSNLYTAVQFPLPGGVTPTDFSIEPDFLSTSDIIPGQALHRPEIRDADLYRFTVDAVGRISVETFAQRLLETSLLDSDLKLWKQDPDSMQFELVAQNGDFYGEDSFIGVEVSPNEGGATATYVIGITANGNDSYDPNIPGSGGGGRSQGRYEMKLSYQRADLNTITDTNGSRLDGDSDGQQGGDFNFWFRAARAKDVAAVNEPRTLFVNSRDGSDSTPAGTLTTPYQTIDYAFTQARPGDIVRLLPDGGDDGLIGTTFDNSAYEVGRGGSGNAILDDGEFFEVPRGVTVMIDAGTILKLRNAKISVGSETVDEDRSLAALQVLGAPAIVDQNGVTIDGQVQLTSYQEEVRNDVLFGIDTNTLPSEPASGDWAGIEFRNDIDYSEGRPVWENEGVFLDYVSNADIRYGGGSVTLTSPAVAPIQMLESRPTLIYNHISDSRDAAISADPNSFLETNFQAPIYQQASLDRFATTFISDYDRVGPHIRGNELENNSLNGLFVRVVTPAAGEREPMTVSGRFDDRDIPHVLSEVLVLQGQPGGPQLIEDRPDVLSVTLSSPASAIGNLISGTSVNYRVTFVTEDGFESLASNPTASVTVGVGGAVNLGNLPSAPAEFAGRRLYRLNSTGGYELVEALDRGTTSYSDIGTTRGGLLSAAALAETPTALTGIGERLLPRVDARLSVDPGIVVKLDTARIEATFGADFYAEGVDGSPIIFTSRLDDRYGGGGTFDTNNDGGDGEAGAGVPVPGDWSGLVFRQGTSASLDFVTLSYAGGDSAVSGGFDFFNPIEILQADVRIAHSTFSDNASGETSGLSTRDGVGFNGPATIFVRGSQPVIVDNMIVDNQGAVISINPDSLNYLSIEDHGRGTGVIDTFSTDGDNQGPLISGNKLDNNTVNGLLIRNESLTTESVWDDTDIVHVVERFVYAYNHHHRSGLRLKSDPNRSLVVKLQDGGALTATAVRTDIVDAIGGTILIMGQPAFPVILTSIHDDTVGAGFTPAGVQQTNTDNIEMAPGTDWYGIIIDAGANDRNVAFVPETERAVGTASGVNAIPDTAQFLGSLARNEVSADENRRLGFNIRGTLSQNSDIDVYKFTANGGTEVFFDIDDSDFGLDTVIELLDVNGNILALSNDSNAESVDPSLLVNNIGNERVHPLRKTGQVIVENPNSLDAGMRVVLPNNSATVNDYYIRVRSNSLAAGDPLSNLTNPALVGAGLSSGQYQLSIRLRETDEIAGSTVRLADIRYATNAIDIVAAPTNSPLASEHAEELSETGLDVNDGDIAFGGGEGTANFANGDADPLGAINISARGALRTSGVLGNNVLTTDANFAELSELDIDVYRVNLAADPLEPNIIGENRFISMVFDVDYADQLGRANTSLAVFNGGGRLVLHSRDSNIADDQGRPTQANDMTNLSAGSAGTLDAFIGPVEMQVGTYYVVVSSSQVIPSSLDQLFEETPTNPLTRILPIDSVRRVAEEGFSDVSIGVNTMSTTAFVSQSLNTTADIPNVIPFFDDTSIVPFKLEDVRLFVSLNGGLTGNDRSALISVDPFTGQLENTIGSFNPSHGDLAIRRDGELFAYSTGPATGQANLGNTGNFLNLDSANANIKSSPDDGITFRQNNEAGTGTEVQNNMNNIARFIINGMAFVPQSGNAGASTGNNPTIPNGERLLAVGNRFGALGRTGEVPADLARNIVYRMEAGDGGGANQGSTNGNADRDFGMGPFDEPFGAGSNKVEMGVLDVGQFADSPPDPITGVINDGGNVTGLAMDPTGGESLVYAVSDQGYVYTFNSSDRRSVDIDGDGDFYSLVINTINHGQVTPDPDDSISSSNGFVEFSSLTLGPRLTERTGTSGEGPYARVLFGTTSTGWIYTMEIDGVTGRVVPAPVLMNGRSAIPITNPGGNETFANVVGVAFSTREENIWHRTGDRGTLGDPGHGVQQPPDATRQTTSGGNSLYFGIEVNNTTNVVEGSGGPTNGTLNPGGAHGSTVSRPFSLEGYNAGDKPTLYFNYYLDVEDNDDSTVTRSKVDSFRVFATGDDGQWRLLGTNNSFREVVNFDEYDLFGTSETPIQELFETPSTATDNWRQARVDLSPLAGSKNVQLRFDFSTAGGMQNRFSDFGYLTEIQAVDGSDVVDGSSFSLFNIESNSFDFNTYEFVRGAAINLPDGNELFDGQQISFTDGVTTTTLTLTTATPVNPDEVQFTRTDSSTTIAANLVTALTTLAPNLSATSLGGQLAVPEAESFSLFPQRFAAASITVPDPATLDGQSVSFTDIYGETASITLTLAPETSLSELTFALTDTPDAIAIAIANRLGQLSSNLQAGAIGDQLLVLAATNVNNSPVFTTTSFNPGFSADQYLAGGDIPIFYHEKMSMIEVRDAIRLALVNGTGSSDITGVSTATIDNYPVYATNRIRAFNQQLSFNDSAIGFSSFLPGDEFGANGSAAIGGGNLINTRPASNNNIEGVYIDDIVVGFAERGEVVLNAPVNRNFSVLPEQRTFSFNNSQQPEFPNQTLVGGYTLEVRPASDYGVEHDYDPIRLGLNEQGSFGRSIDTNDRFTESVTLIAPDGASLIDGDTFTLSNGTQTKIFEFDSDGSVAMGNVGVPFIPSDIGVDFRDGSLKSEFVATSIRDAINSTQAFSVLGIYAAGRDGSEVGTVTGNRIDLFGDSIEVNASSGRFLKVDLVEEEAFYGVESARTLPFVDHDTQTVTDAIFYDTFARATVTDYVNGMTDTLVATGKIGDHVGTGDGNELLGSSPVNDADIVKIFLNAGDTIDVDLDTNGWALGSQIDQPPRITALTTGAGLDGQSVTVKNDLGETTVTLTLNTPTSPNEVQYLLSDSTLFIAFRLANAFDSLDSTLDANFDGSGVSFGGVGVEVVSLDPGFGFAPNSLLEIYDENLLAVANSSASGGRADGETQMGSWINDFVAATSGYYYVRVSTTQFSSSRPEGFGEYQLTVRPGALIARDVMMVDYHSDFGDANRFRDQGQLIIESNFISNFGSTGIRATFDPGGTTNENDGNFSTSVLDRRPGAVTLLRNENTDRLLPGTVISNNVVIADNSAGPGIIYSGEVGGSGNSPVPVPFGRIVNNTVVGNGGTGIQISDAASPTVLNNIISGFDTGLDVSVNSPTIVGGNAFQRLDVNSVPSTIGLAASSFEIAVGDQLFQDRANGIFIPFDEQVIDSSFASLNDRSDFVNTVKQPVGISASPIIAPLFDAYGIPRFNDPDVTTPGGVGSNVSIDRGAIDRADTVRPIAELVSPLDFVLGGGVTVAGGDIDPSDSFVRLIEGSVEFFEIQLFDPSGAGPDAQTITIDSVILTENGTRLVPDVDYTFGYSDNSRLIRLTPLAGLWRTDAVYQITLNNQTRFAYQAPSGDQISDGDQVLITDADLQEAILEFESGYSLAVPQTTLLTITGPNSAFTDRNTFTISFPGTTAVTFEINTTGTATAGRVAVELGSANTIAEVRDAFLAAFASPAPGDATVTVAEFLNLAPVAVGGDGIQLGTLAGHVGPAPINGTAVSGQTDGVGEGDTFTYTTASEEVTFEFDIDGTLADTNNEPINITRFSTPEEIAAEIVAAVRRRNLGLGTAVASGATAVLGGSVGDEIDVSSSPQLTLQGTPGVTGSLSLEVPPGTGGVALQGDTFSITVEGVPTTFRYTTSASPSDGPEVILLAPTDLVDTIAQKTAAQIELFYGDDLAPTADGGRILLGETSSSVSANGGTARLIVGGVSGGAVAVGYLPSSPRASIAATLQGAIASTSLSVTTFAPGGGTILFGNVDNVQTSTGGGAPVDAGVLTPAVADLAGNPVRETRPNNETRFTIIMPEVVFDFGDAPDVYGTLLANNGPRHTVDSSRLPRLGDFLDTESDGQPVDLDDATLVIAVSSTVPSGAPEILSIDSTNPAANIITLTGLPAGSETLTISAGSITRTFEFIDVTANPAGTNVAINFSDSDTIETLAARMTSVVRSELLQAGRGLEVLAVGTNALTLNAIDDEDGVLTGVFNNGTTDFNVFLLPETVDTTNVQATEVLGFLNRKDPAGTNIAVKVFGAGLLQAWIDFDQNNVFDADELVVPNVPVSGDAVNGTFNFVTVLTPLTATVGETWMRLRISESGNLQPTGVTVGGEVEDYRVEVLDIDLPSPADDVYSTDEDVVLNSLNLSPPQSLGDNDTVPPDAFLPVRYILGSQPENGSVTLDGATGHFVYTPSEDFNGVDTFTYRLSTQQNESGTAINLDSFATVTINVAAINDVPGVPDKTFPALEDLPLTITADEFLVGASGDSTVSGTLTPPLDESNQQVVVTSLTGDGGTITAANTFNSTAGNLRVTLSAGGGLDIEATSTASDLVSLAFAGLTATFEIVPVGQIPASGTTPVLLQAGDGVNELATKLATAIQNRFAAASPSVSAVATTDTVALSFTATPVSATSSAAAYTITPGTVGSLSIELASVPIATAAPTPAQPNPPVGDTISVDINGSVSTFEFLAEGATPATGNIGVSVLPFADSNSDAARASATASLAAAIAAVIETDQVGVVAAINDGATNPYRVDLAPAAITAAKPFATARGSAIALFDSQGALIEVRYVSGQDLNRDNPPPANPALLDQFTFIVRDDGVSYDLTNNRFVYGAPLESLPATAFIDVAPQNDPPLLVPDLVSVGPLGPDAANVQTAWEIFGGATPLEDTALTINPTFLLQNDLRGPVSAGDENAPNSQNDTGLTITSVAMVDSSQGSVSLSGGMIVFTPAPDVYGDVIFTYSARDGGIPTPLSSTNGTVTVKIQPVNDAPVSFDRALQFTESGDAGPGDPFVFTRQSLILGSGSETPASPGRFPVVAGVPFNEDAQTAGLNVVAFTTVAGTVDVNQLATGTGTLTLASDEGGSYEFDYVNGIFTVGRFISAADFNERAPFSPTETFTYVIADDGLTLDPQGEVASFNLPSVRSDVASTVTIQVTQTNDAPTFTLNNTTINVLERDDSQATVIENFATNILPGPASARDEIDPQNVTFTFPAALNASVPAGLFTRLPELTPEGALSVFPVPDAIGTATLVVQATDAEPSTANFDTRSTLRTFTINVRPVNDPPRFDPAIAGTSDARDADDAYSVANVDDNNDGIIDNATIQYTLREDNTQANGVLADFFIPLRAASTVGYNRVGLLDVFTVGPANEVGPFEAGSQTIEFENAGNPATAPGLDRTTQRGGILKPVFDSNQVLIGLNYQPPKDLNFAFAGVDSFAYTVVDDSPGGGETFSLASGALVPDRLTSTNLAELVLNPVNDRPEFDPSDSLITVLEDEEQSFLAYASNISAGPADTAFDETDAVNGQLVEFTVTSLDFPRSEADKFFSVYPSISESTGQLTFKSAPDVFGSFRFEVVLSDRNRDGSVSNNTTRGDLISSVPVTLTIDVLAQNDRPRVDPTADPLVFEILEDGQVEVLVEGDNTSRGLLDVFLPGPSEGAADESADIAPRPGGNQTIDLGSPSTGEELYVTDGTPAGTAEGGTLELVTTNGVRRFVYRPAPDFVGTDSFIYTVVDNGENVLADGSVILDPRTSSNIVTIEVLPVNDAPQFSGASNVESDEDEGVVTHINWATNIQNGPTTAVDENNGIGLVPAQTSTFKFTQLSSDTDLFVAAPTAIIDPASGTASLTYQTRPNASGTAVFTVVLEDDGPRDAGIGDVFVSSPPRTFTIDVAPVNDPPTFDLVEPTVTRNEDSGPYSATQLVNISAGPSDEASQTIAFAVEPLAPELSVLFSEQPSINASGVLRFTPAPNQNTAISGPVPIRIIATDSEGAVSDSVVFNIVISEVNDSPLAVSDSFGLNPNDPAGTDEDSVLQIAASLLTANDNDPDSLTNPNETLQIVLPSNNLSVSGALVSYNPDTGIVTYDPRDANTLQALAPGDELVDSFSYSLIDSTGLRSNQVTVAINVTGINDAPQLELDSPTLNPDGPTILRPLDNDTDIDGFIDPQSILVTLQPAFGSLNIQDDGSIIYTPFNSFATEDVFRYSVADDLGLRSEEALVTIAANAAPTALDDGAAGFLDEAIVIPVSNNDTDSDGELALDSISIVTNPRRGEAFAQADGSIQYVPAAGFIGEDTFRYRIFDTEGRPSNIADVNVRIVASRLQNPDRFSDVNDDGVVTAIDALLIINRLASTGGQSIPVTQSDSGPNFFDVSGNQSISVLDALQVINELSVLNNSIGREFIEPSAVIDAPRGGDLLSDSSFEQTDTTETFEADKLTSVGQPDVVAVDVIDLIAADHDTDDDEDSETSAIDTAMAELF